MASQLNKSSNLFCKIYKITNTINNKVYIGQTWIEKLSYRLKKHSNAESHCKFLRNSIRKNGIDKFIIEFLMVCNTQQTADYWENYWIKKYNSDNKKFGYNLKTGGVAGKHTLETKKKIGLASLGNQYGRKFSKKQYQNMISLYMSGICKKDICSKYMCSVASLNIAIRNKDK